MPATRFVFRNYARNGLSLSFDLVAVDANGVVDTAFAGSAAFTASNSTIPGLPASYGFTAADQGIHRFSTTLTTIENVQIFAASAGLDTAGIYLGGAGPDTNTGAGGGDAFDQGAGANDATGNAGEDNFIVTGGTSTVSGGAGTDRLVIIGGDNLGNSVTLSGSLATGYSGTIGGGGLSAAFTGIENFTISTSNNSSDNVTTGDGADEYNQVALDSAFYIRDTVNLGGGIDRLSVDARLTNGTLSLLALNYDGSGEVGLYGNGKLGFTGVERFFLQGGNAGDDLRGLDFDDRLEGNAGNDRIAGRGGNDMLLGGTGNDVIDGDGRATILLAADNQNNAGTGTSDNDFRVNGNFTAANPFEADVFTGAANVGTVRMRVRAIDVEANETNEVYVNDTLVGTLAQFATGLTGDTILSFDSALLSTGVARVRVQNVGAGTDGFTIQDVELTVEKIGDDLLDGGAGVDQLVGGRGNDTYIVDEDRDQAQEQAGGGIDTVLSQGRTFILGANVENLGASLATTATALTGELPVNTPGQVSAQSVTTTTALADGGYVITWLDQNNGNDAFARVFNANGSARSGALQIADATAGNQGQLGMSAVALSSGGFLVAIYADTTGNEQIIGRRYDANGVAQTGELVLVDTVGSSFDRSPVTARLDSGQVALVWVNREDGVSNFGIRLRLLNADGSVGAAPILLNTTLPGDQIDPVIAKLDDGRLIVAWESREPAGDVIRARIIGADGTPVGNDFTVSAQGGDLTRTAITGINGGGFVVTWDGGGDVSARVFDSAGLPIGSEFFVHPGAAGTQESSSVTRLPEGGFMAGWNSSAGEDGNAYSVLGRLFNADGTARGDQFVINQLIDGWQLSPRFATLTDGRVAVGFTTEAQQAGNYDVRTLLLDTTPDQTLIGNELNNRVTGGFGNDIIAGSGGADTLTGNQGADLIYGGDVTGSGTNLIVNGSFETQNGTNITRDFILGQADGIGEGIAYRGVTSLFGWTRGNTNALIELETNSSSTLFATGSGTAVVNLEYGGNEQQSLSQDIAGLVAGQRYLLSFAAMQLASASAFTATMQVVWNGVVIATVTPETRAPGFYLFTVEAASGTNSISFREISSGDAGGTTLDAISLEALVAAPDFNVGIGPNLIANGSFEQRTAGETSRDFTVANGLTNFNGGDPIYVFSNQLLNWGFLPGTSRVEFNTDNPANPTNIFQTGDGLVGLDMDVAGNEPVGIFQDVSGLAAGARYRITVSVALPLGPNNNGDQSAALQVIWNGRVVGTVTPTSLTPTDFSFDVFAQANGAGVGGANRVAFQEVGAEGGQGRGTILDNIRLNLVTGVAGATDTVDYGAESGSGGVTVNLATGTATDSFGSIDRLFGIENVRGTVRNDTITGDGAVNLLLGGDGNDVLDGAGGIDGLAGGAGNDRLIGGADTVNELVGGIGDDIYVIGNAGDSIVEGAGEGTDTIETALAAFTLLAANVENLTGTGTTGQSLSGNAGNNRITGGVGNDQLVGGAGNDTYVVVNAGDTIVEAVGGGNDTIETALAVYAMTAANVENLVGTSATGQILAGTAGNDRITGGLGNDELIGGAGNDTYVILNAGDTIAEAVGGGNDTIETALAAYVQTALNVENLVGTLSTGQALGGNAGNNRITGGIGNDQLAGGLGDDTYVLLNVGDSILEAVGAGTDTVETALAVYTLTAANVENLTGTAAGGQLLIGSAGANRITGGIGNDEMAGRAGDDVFVVANIGDTIVETAGEGNDTIETVLTAYSLGVFEIENLVFTGTGDFFGAGNGFGNTITGGSGNDLLRGDLGNDVLVGNGGADLFLFDTTLGAGNVDTISGFLSGSDRIALDNTIFTALGEGGVPDGIFVLGTVAGDANDRLIYDAATGALFYDADGTGAGAAIQFATLSPALSLSASDFVVL